MGNSIYATARRQDQNELGDSWEGNVNIRIYETAGLSKISHGPIPCTVLEVEPKSEVLPRNIPRINETALPVGNIAKTDPPEISGSIKGMTASLFRMLMLSSESDLNVAGGTVTAEAVNDIVLDTWYQLDQRNVNPADIVVTVGVTTYDNTKRDIDWAFDEVSDRIMFLESGAIAALADATIAYSYDGITGTIFRVGSQPKFDIQLSGVFQNREQPDVYRDLFINKATLATSGKIRLLGDAEYVDVPFTAKSADTNGIRFYERFTKAAH